MLLTRLVPVLWPSKQPWSLMTFFLCCSGFHLLPLPRWIGPRPSGSSCMAAGWVAVGKWHLKMTSGLMSYLKVSIRKHVSYLNQLRMPRLLIKVYTLFWLSLLVLLILTDPNPDRSLVPEYCFCLAPGIVWYLFFCCWFWPLAPFLTALPFNSRISTALCLWPLASLLTILLLLLQRYCHPVKL